MSLNNNCLGTTSGCGRPYRENNAQSELIPDPLLTVTGAQRDYR